jgi:putative membrane protein
MARGVDQVVAGVFSSLVPSAVAAQERSYEWGGWHVHPLWGLSGLWHLGIMLLILAFWGVVIAGVVLGIRWLGSQGKGPQPDPALEILRRRYARGDISKDEFEAKKRDLT